MDENQALTTDLQSQPKVRIWKGLDIVLISLASVFLIILGTLGTSFLAQRTQQDLLNGDSLPLVYNAALAGVEVVAFTGSVYFLGMRRRELSWKQLGFIRTSPGWIWTALQSRPRSFHS